MYQEHERSSILDKKHKTLKKRPLQQEATVSAAYIIKWYPNISNTEHKEVYLIGQ